MNSDRNFRQVCSTLLVLTLAFAYVRPAAAQSDFIVYDDILQNGTQNWSWNGTYNVASTDYAHSGTKSIAATYSGQWAGLQIGFPNRLNTSTYTSLTFYINGGSVNGRSIFVKFARNNVVPDNGAPLNNYVTGGSVAANTWRQVTIPLTDLNAVGASDVTSLVIQDYGAGAQPTFYLDDIKLVAKPITTTLSIDAANVLRIADQKTLGINATIWDNVLGSSQTLDLMKQMGTKLFRMPGGSLSDDYHWNGSRSDSGNFSWGNNTDTFASLILGAGAQAIVTTNYGSGTDQEAADWVRYCNVTKKYGFKYWEIGNENYGTWEVDKNARPHDPYTYAQRAKTYIQKMKAVDPTIKIGVVIVTGEDSSVNYTDHPVTNPRTGVTHNGWTPVMLTTLKSLGVIPDYVVYHRYDQAPNYESDLSLLQGASTWKNDALDLRQQLNDYLGSAAAGVDIVCTENNSVYSNPGKQSTSLVNGLFMADSFANLMQTEIKGMVWWDLRNGQETGNNNSSLLYGWRNYGDYGVVSATNDTYPTYYVGKLLNSFVQGGDKIVTTNSNNSLVSVYASLKNDLLLRLLVINKNGSATQSGNFAIANFVPTSSATTLSYGMAQDNAAQTGSGSRDLASGTMSSISPNFSTTFPPYSVTVLTLTRANTTLSGTVSLEGLTDMAQPLTFVLTPLGGTATTRTVTPASNGTFTLSEVTPGAYHLTVKGTKWLRQAMDTTSVNGVFPAIAFNLLTGDVNNDNFVNVDDLTALLDLFNTTKGDGVYLANADLNNDNRVDVDDLTLLLFNFNVAGDN